MNRYELQKFQTAEALAETAALNFLELAQALRNEKQEPAHSKTQPALIPVALSGGRIARVFCSALARLARQKESSLDLVHFFWGDERCVPPTDPESNFGLAQENLLVPLAIPSVRVHRINGELPAETAAKEAEKEMRELLPLSSEGHPIIDLVLLGVGEDGHVASLFPSETEKMRESPAIFRAVIGPKPPPSRVTIGYGTIATAREVWVLASGAGKTQALKESLAPEGDTPLARVLKLRSVTRILTDIPLR